MTWKEVLNSTAKTVTVLSSGHEIPFKIRRYDKIDGLFTWGFLDHPYFILGEDEENLTYELRSDGVIVLEDTYIFYVA